MLDAPISGGTKGAEDGTLTSIVSGAPGTVHEVRSVLSDLARNVFVVGDRPGLAQTCKLVNNALSLTAMMLTSEAIVAGVAAGLDARTMIDVINVSTGRNSATLDKFPRMLAHTGDSGQHAQNGLPPVERALLANKPTDPFGAVMYDSAARSRGFLDPDPRITSEAFKGMVESVTSGKERSGEALSRANSQLQAALR